MVMVGEERRGVCVCVWQCMIYFFFEKKYDTSKDGFLDLMELKYLMEKLGHPQTHVGLKAMIK